MLSNNLGFSSKHHLPPELSGLAKDLVTGMSCRREQEEEGMAAAMAEETIIELSRLERTSKVTRSNH